MIPYETALNILFRSEKMDIINADPQYACGHVMAGSLESQVNVPPFANSAMDGFAVDPEDIKTASPETPISLPILGCTYAGDMPDEKVGKSPDKSGAWEIMTGAPIPDDYSAVVKIEDVKVEKDHVTFTSPVEKQNNIRMSGEDIAIGDMLIEENTLLTPYHIMAMATVGQKRVQVYNKPKITIFNTGKELAEDDDEFLRPGQIRNSNGPFLSSMIRTHGYRLEHGGTILDDQILFEKKLRENLSRTDIIISTGAVSAGKHDFIPDSLERLGARILFHKVSVRPGKPILYARFEDGQHYFGLPGNPISAATGLRFFVMPLLRHIQSLPPEKPLQTVLREDIHKKQGLRFFRKAHLSMTEADNPRLHILDGQQSFKIKPMLEANCWAVLAEDHDGTKEGGTVQVYPLFTSNPIFEGLI